MSKKLLKMISQRNDFFLCIRNEDGLTMARQAPFTEHEAVLLLDAYLQTVSGDASRKDAVKDCSDALRRMAINQGIEIEDVYRNTNGISFQMASMESAYRGHTITKPATKLFTKTVAMYRNDRKKYEELLKEAMSMADDKYNGEATFMSWLAKKVSPAQLSELYMAFQEIEQQAIKAKIVQRSLYETIDVNVFRRVRSNIEQSRVFKFTHKRQMGRINSALNYLLQYAQNGIAPEKEQKPIEKEQIPIEKKSEFSDKKRDITTPVAKSIEVGADIRVIDLDAIPDMSFTKPVLLSYFGEEMKETSWRTLYVDLCKKLIDDYPKVLNHLRQESLSGRTKVWLVDDAHTELLAAPKMVMRNYHIETNRSAQDIIKSIKWLLNQCLIDYENVVIQYIKDGKNKKEIEHKPAAHLTERRYKRDDKEEFYQWLIHDQHMAEASCRGYVSSIRSAEKYAAEHAMESVRLFGVSAEDARKTADALFSDTEFVEKNENWHNRFRAPITKLLAYLGEDWTPPDKSFPEKRTAATENIYFQVNVQPFEAVLVRNFPHGYRLGSSIEMKRFRRYFEEINGYASVQESDDIERAIRLCGIEHEGKVYVPEAMLSRELRDRLFDFIDKSFNEGKPAIYYEALFKEFSEEFLDHNIYDAQMLKAYISHMAGDKYFMTRSYLSVEKRPSADPIEDVRNCLKEHGLPMEVDELCRTLSHIPSKRIGTLLGTHGEFVRNSKGEYFHADSFFLTKEELDNISALIQEEIMRHSYISGNELYDAIKGKYPHIYERNAVFSVIGWRDALKFKLGDRFSFIGNIISSKEDALSMSDVFAAYGEEQKSFTFSELLAFAENMGSTIYFDSLYRNAARVSQEYFVSKDAVNFQVNETDKILDRFCVGNYLALPEIKDFGIFPEASHPWTPYLLEHYVAFHSKRYYLVHGAYNGFTVVGAMVKKEKVYESFDDLIVDVLAENEVALHKKNVLDYLCNKGYIARRSYANIEDIIIRARAKRNMEEN